MTTDAIVGQTWFRCYLGYKKLLHADVEVLYYNEDVQDNLDCFHKW